MMSWPRHLNLSGHFNTKKNALYPYDGYNHTMLWRLTHDSVTKWKGVKTRLGKQNTPLFSLYSKNMHNVENNLRYLGSNSTHIWSKQGRTNWHLCLWGWQRGQPWELRKHHTLGEGGYRTSSIPFRLLRDLFGNVTFAYALCSKLCQPV